MQISFSPDINIISLFYSLSKIWVVHQIALVTVFKSYIQKKKLLDGGKILKN